MLTLFNRRTEYFVHNILGAVSIFKKNINYQTLKFDSLKSLETIGYYLN